MSSFGVALQILDTFFSPSILVPTKLVKFVMAFSSVAVQVDLCSARTELHCPFLELACLVQA